MDAPRTATDTADRWMAWSGPLFLVLFLAMVVLTGDAVGETASGREVVDEIGDRKEAQFAAVFLAVPASAVLLLFAGRLATRLKGGGAGRRIMQYGAVLYASSILVSSMVQLALVSAADKELEDVARTLNVLNAASWIPVVGGVAVMLIGAGLAVLRTAALPRWLGWVALVAGVLSLLGPGGFLGFFVGPIWIGIAGVLLSREPERSEAVGGGDGTVEPEGTIVL